MKAILKVIFKADFKLIFKVISSSIERRQNYFARPGEKNFRDFRVL